MTKRPQDIIGGTDVAALMDLYYPQDERWNPYKSAFDVYASIVEGVKLEDTLQLALGRAGEGPILEDYCNRHDIDFAAMRRNVRYIDPARTFRSAEVDAVHEAGSLGLDAKLVRSPRQQRAWEAGDEPTHYICQIAYERKLSGCQRMVLVASLNDGPRDVEYTEQPDLEAALFESAEKFWHDHVEKRVPPSPLGASVESVRAVYPFNNGKLREATPDESQLIREFQLGRDARKTAEEFEDEVKAKLQAAIADLDGIYSPDGKVTWKQVTLKPKTDWEAVAKACKPAPALIQEHTATPPGYRRFLLSPTKS